MYKRQGKCPVQGRAGAVGYLVGQPGKGLACMFHMMNEARIGIGMAATMLGLAGYYASLDYAKNRPQGRLVGASGKDAAQPQAVSYTHLRAHETVLNLVCRLLLEKKKIKKTKTNNNEIYTTKKSHNKYNTTQQKTYTTFYTKHTR